MNLRAFGHDKVSLGYLFLFYAEIGNWLSFTLHIAPRLIRLIKFTNHRLWAVKQIWWVVVKNTMVLNSDTGHNNQMMCKGCFCMTGYVHCLCTSWFFCSSAIQTCPTWALRIPLPYKGRVPGQWTQMEHSQGGWDATGWFRKKELLTWPSAQS